MKIAFVVNNYPPKVGGVELHVQALAKELVRAGHEVLVITLGEQIGLRSDDSVTVVTMREKMRVADTFGFPTFNSVKRIKRLLKSHRIDVVSVHTRFFPMTIIGLAHAKALKIPAVLTEHGSDHVAHESPLIRIASKIVDLTFGHWAFKQANTVLGVSQAACDFVQRVSGVRAKVFNSAIPARAAQITPDPRPEHLVFVGRMISGKGWDDFIHTVANLRAKNPAVTAEMLGDGGSFTQARELIAKKNLAGVIKMRGRVSAQQVRAALAGATLVNPSKLSEGFQTTLLESLDSGGRIVTYRVPGASELLHSGAPVVISQAKTVSCLAAAVQQMWRENPAPWPQHKLTAWKWPSRAADYIRICEDLNSSRQH